MAFTILTSDVFEDWFDKQEKALKRSILMSLRLLSEKGYQLGRPHADTLKGSEIKNLKELRVQYKNNPYRILFAFDPKRQAVLLLGGNKAADKKWYERMIPIAERLFATHLEDLKRQEEDNSGH